MIYLTYLLMGVILTVYILKTNHTNTGMFSWSQDQYYHSYNSGKSGFDGNYYALFIAAWLASPLTLPLLIFGVCCYYIANFIFNRYIKKD